MRQLVASFLVSALVTFGVLLMTYWVLARVGDAAQALVR
jgi:hypothetical protein